MFDQMTDLAELPRAPWRVKISISGSDTGVQQGSPEGSCRAFVLSSFRAPNWGEEPLAHGFWLGKPNEQVGEDVKMVATSAAFPPSTDGSADDPDFFQSDRSSQKFQFSERVLQKTLNDQFALYKRLPLGWDGYSGSPLNEESMRDAELFLKCKPDNIRLPHPQLSSRGEVGLYWETKDVLIDITFFGDGTYNYYTFQRFRDGEIEEGGDDDCRVGEWPPEMKVVLENL